MLDLQLHINKQPPALAGSVDRAQAQKRYIGCLFCEVGSTQSLLTTNSTHQTLSSSSKWNRRLTVAVLIQWRRHSVHCCKNRSSREWSKNSKNTGRGPEVHKDIACYPLLRSTYIGHDFWILRLKLHLVKCLELFVCGQIRPSYFREVRLWHFKSVPINNNQDGSGEVFLCVCSVSNQPLTVAHVSWLAFLSPLPLFNLTAKTAVLLFIHSRVQIIYTVEVQNRNS